jgi:hypothetical protein
MAAGPHSPNTLMIRKLESTAHLSDDEKQALQGMPVQVTVLRADQDFVRIGDRPDQDQGNSGDHPGLGEVEGSWRI